MLIYLDESGDLGWNFTAPYRQGGSSRYLTIASLAVTPEKKHLPKRLIRNLYKKFGWDPKLEKKWSEMTMRERTWFAQKSYALKMANPHDISYMSITVQKDRVMDHIRNDSNKLYNYMIGLSLLDEMSKHDRVTFIPDPRSVKVESGNSLHDYLQTQLWFEKRAPTTLITTPCDSASSSNVQFADMMSGVVQGHFEDSKDLPWRELEDQIIYKKLFFKHSSQPQPDPSIPV